MIYGYVRGSHQRHKGLQQEGIGEIAETDSEVGSTNKEYLRCTGIGTLGKMEESVI